MIDFNTRANSCIDNIFINFTEYNCFVESQDVPYLSDHRGLLMRLDVDDASTPSKKLISYRPISDEGLFLLYNAIELQDWGFVDSKSIDPDTRFTTFVDIISGTMEEYAYED